MVEYTGVNRLEGSGKAGWMVVLGPAAAAGKVAVAVMMAVGDLLVAIRMRTAYERPFPVPL